MRGMKLAVVAVVLLSPPAIARPCGVERWKAKVLSSPTTLMLAPRTITVAGLNALPKACAAGNADRSGVELQLYRVTATVKLIKHEDDGDLHIVLEDATGHTAVVESP